MKKPMMTVSPIFIRRLGMLILAFALVGCASTGNPRDPMENFNRAMFSFNDSLDKNALKPAAEAYQTVTPSFVQTGIGNFFANLGDVWTGVNNLLQGKPTDAAQDAARFVINTTVGVVGLIDVASQTGLPKHKEDFGQTLGKWGVASGPYLVLPLFGSSTLRDTLVMPVDWKGDLWLYKDPTRWRNAGSVVRLVDARAAVLDASNLIEEAALDRYEFVRDAYLQRRQNTIDDGGNGKGMSFDENGQIKIAEKLNPDGTKAEPFYKGIVKYLRPGEVENVADKTLAK
jgi:phospholipid-binding lipoprotein MlaA